MKYAPFGTTLQKFAYYVIVCFDKHCTDVNRQIVPYLYKCIYVDIQGFIQRLDLGPLSYGTLANIPDCSVVIFVLQILFEKGF